MRASTAAYIACMLGLQAAALCSAVLLVLLARGEPEPLAALARLRLTRCSASLRALQRQRPVTTPLAADGSGG